MLDVPATQAVREVPHRPCSELHDAEVIAALAHPAAKGAAFPTDEAWQIYVFDTCVPAFKTYTGLELATAREFDLGYFHPIASAWTDGDRAVTCYLYRVDGAKFAGSRKQ